MAVISSPLVSLKVQDTLGGLTELAVALSLPKESWLEELLSLPPQLTPSTLSHVLFRFRFPLSRSITLSYIDDMDMPASLCSVKCIQVSKSLINLARLAFSPPRKAIPTANPN